MTRTVNLDGSLASKSFGFDLTTGGAGNVQLALESDVIVAEGDVLTPEPTTITGDPNQPLTNAVVAAFYHSNTPNTASDFIATIDWGDGNSATAGTVWARTARSRSWARTPTMQWDRTP